MMTVAETEAVHGSRGTPHKEHHDETVGAEVGMVPGHSAQGTP